MLFISCLLLVGYGLFKAESPAQIFAASDKVGHILAFFCLSLSGFFVVPLSLKAKYWWFWALLITLACLSEYLQGLARPLRYASWEDALANLAGVLLAFILIYLTKRCRAVRRLQSRG